MLLKLSSDNKNKYYAMRSALRGMAEFSREVMRYAGKFADVNKDNKISGKELSDLITVLDTNKDGRVSLGEVAKAALRMYAHKSAAKPKPKSAMEKLYQK